MSPITGKSRLAEAFKNLGLEDSRKQLDALKKTTSPSPATSKDKGKSTGNKMPVAKMTIAKKPIVNSTIAESTIAKKAGTVKTKTPAKNVAKKTIAEKTMAKPTIVNKTTETPRSSPATPPPLPNSQQRKKTETTIADTAIVKKTTGKPSTFWGLRELWELIDTALPHLYPNEITLYMPLLREAYGRDNTETGFISMNELCKRTGLYSKSIPVALAALDRKGYVRPIEEDSKRGKRYRVHGLTYSETKQP